MQHIPCGTAINLAVELILFTMHALMLPTCTILLDDSYDTAYYC